MSKYLTRLGNPILGNDLSSPTPGEAGSLLGRIFSGFFSILILGSLLFFFVQFVLGGIKWILSEGSEDKVKTARNQIRDAAAGLGIVFAVFVIVRLIGYVFGISGLEKLQIPLIPLI